MTRIPRNCYCETYVQDRAAPLPPGFCGRCETCGEPGHTSHVPAPIPYTGSWCDDHHDLIAWAFDEERPPGERTFVRISSAPECTYYVEVERDMAFRVVLESPDGLSRFEHGDIRLGISVWISPIEAWEQSTQPMQASQFEDLWSRAMPASA